MNRNIKSKITLLNIMSSLIMQIVSVISALIVPRLILETFGSNANGLVSSISQFLNYISLVEGGITGVIAASLYKPLVDENNYKLSSVLATARSFYRKIGAIFIAYSIIIGLLYPLFVKTGYDYWYIFSLTIVLSIGLLLEYMFSLTFTTLLNADKRVYCVSITSSVLTIANIFLTLAVIKFFPDMILLKFANASLFALKPLVYGAYIKKHYDVDWSAKKDNSLISQRWSGFSINLAFFIHTSTDITLLTLFSDLNSVSVYSVYFLVISKISVLINALTSSLEPTVGQAYASNDECKLNEKMDLYEFIILFSVGFLFLMMGLLITPFVMIYTKGINDANYYQPLFGAIIVLAEATYLLRSPHVSLAYSANKFKEITIPAYVEAVINIIISILLLKKIGLVGIAIGTLAGMIYRGAFHVYFTSKLVPSRPQSFFYKKLLIVVGMCILCTCVCKIFFPIPDFSISSWLLYAVIYGVICILVFGLGSLCFFKKELVMLKNYIKR